MVGEAGSLQHAAGDGEQLIRIGISACTLGHEVRFNGGYKLDRFIRDTLGVYVEFVPVCPEFDIALGVPRETLRLVEAMGPHPSMIAPKSGSDHTPKMVAYSRRKTTGLAGRELCGFIVQKGSPSCGMERVSAVSWFSFRRGLRMVCPTPTGPARNSSSARLSRTNVELRMLW